MAFNGANPGRLIRVRLADLVPGTLYQLPEPFTVRNSRYLASTPFEQ